MKNRSAIVFCLFALTIVLAVCLPVLTAGCGSGSASVASASSTQTSAALASTSTSVSLASTSTSARMSPEQLGERIGSVSIEALKKVTTMLESKPDPAAARQQVESLKEEYITLLVPLGKQREQLSARDRATTDSRASKVMLDAGFESWYESYNSMWKYYSDLDREFANLVAAFNILGQYANFDLLKKQAPAEAERLGIK